MYIMIASLICLSLQLIKKYFCENSIEIQSSESLHFLVEFAEDRIILDFPNMELISGNWKLKPGVHPEVR